MAGEFLGAQRDALTNLLSRSQFLYAAGHMMPNASSAAVLLVNLDRFRLVNDNFTYSNGDLVLREAAGRLVQEVPQDALVSRLSGDEFAIALFHFDNESVHALAERIRNKLAEPYRVSGAEVVVTASIGIAFDDARAFNCEQLLQRADSASRTAKEQGRNQICEDVDESTDGMSPLVVETLLRSALRNSDLEIYYQPKIQTKSMQVVGAEALCRWRHPELGEIPPQSFIPIAESSDLILPVDEYVLRAVCIQGSSWLRDGYRVRMSVNVSSRQFLHPSFTALVRNVLNETGMDPTLLELEITERTAMTDVDHAVHVLHELRDLGVRTAIDDFGVGYSSLNYLIRFPVHTLKIDRSFTAGIQGSINQNPVIGAIISLAKSLNLNVVAEGVETVQQFDFLRDSMCDEIQGYLFGEPVPPSSFRVASFVVSPQYRNAHTIGQDEGTLAVRLHEFEWLDRISQHVNRRPQLHEIVSHLTDALVDRMPYDRLSVELAAPDDEYFSVHEASIRDDVPARPVGTLLPLAHSGLSYLRKTHQPSMCGDILRNPEFAEDYELSAEGIQSIIRVPLIRGHEVFGLLSVQSVHKNVYFEEDRATLWRVATRLADALYASFLEDARLRTVYVEPGTKLYSRGFLLELLHADEPSTFLSNMLRRPIHPVDVVTAVYVSVCDFAKMQLEEGEYAMSYLGQFLSTHTIHDSIGIRMGASDFLILVLNDVQLPIAHFTQQLRDHLGLLHVRAARIGDAGQSFDVKLGKATGTWKGFSDIYHQAMEDAMTKDPLGMPPRL
ncbi:EAL domain-containing protein [Alicyclobacillus acidiphilus]|uniref:EAL domain-containing protein n=1 Tax=Alicyclobacillus acidiphilus TaxID=182455 RepID=UPI000AA7A546|nr:EAL domain-containing protein [Alicyclobacillus acidiphilus]